MKRKNTEPAEVPDSSYGRGASAPFLSEHFGKAVRKRRIADSFLRHYGRDQGMIRNVKGRIVAFHLRKRHGLLIELRLDFIGIPQLYGYVFPGRTV